MKKLLSFLLIVASTPAWAQFPWMINPDTTHNILDINNVETRINAVADMWYDPQSEAAECTFPAGSGKTIGYSGALWMAGYDNDGMLRLAAQTYRQDGLDYRAGPEGLPPMADSVWRKVWKISQSDINEFLSITTHTVENTPAAILDWPAKDNPYATDRYGEPLTIAEDMAPFVDVDGNGSYNPLTGDYPAIKGDQMLWNIYNDGIFPHEHTAAYPLHMVVRQSVYGYNRSTLIDNVVFYEFELTNTSSYNYTDFRAAFFADLDIGNPFDDYLGFDSTFRMGIGFNGLTYDSVYEDSTPVVGVALLETPGDTIGALQPIGDFATYDNNFTPSGNPSVGPDFYNYMHGKNIAGTTLHHDSLYRLNLTVAGGDSYECLTLITPSDRRFVLAPPSITFPAGATRKYAYAMVVAPNGGGCPSIDLTGLAEVADTALSAYYHPLPVGVAAVIKAPALHLYPNPAAQEIYLTTDKEVERVAVTSTLGQVITLPFRKEGQKISVSVAALPAGVYTLSVSGKGFREHAPFVKQ